MNKADVELYDRLYKENWDKLFAFAKNVLHSKFLAEELTQKTFVVCCCKFEDVKAHPAPERWLKRVMKNMIGNEYRKSKVRNEYADSSAVEQLAEAEHKEKLDDILPLELPAADRQLLIWAYEDLYTCGDIAKRLGISENACRTRLFRARERCKEIMQKNKLNL